MPWWTLSVGALWAGSRGPSATSSPADPSGDADFTAGALAKDLGLLAAATGSVPEVGEHSGPCWPRLGGARRRHRVRRRRAPDTSWLADARLDVSPEVVVDPAVLRPLHSYALTHATGDPSYLAEAFLPTARIDGYRDGALVSWGLDEFRGLFAGEPAADEATRARRLERLDVRGSVATATMTLSTARLRSPTSSSSSALHGRLADRQQGLRATHGGVVRVRCSSLPRLRSTRRSAGAAQARLD